jgi:hypothetical protein
MKTRGLVRAKAWAMLAVMLCSLTLPLANAQTNRKSNIPPGFTVIDGDILVPTWQYNLLLESRRQKPNTPAAIFQTNLWPNGIVPFQFNNNVTPLNRTNMINAMAVLQNVANVNFQQCANNSCSGNFVLISNSTENSSRIGMVSGQQEINISDWFDQFIIVHELLHCLGFWHEHQRADRENYVHVDCANVQGGCQGQIYLGQFLPQTSPTAYGYYDFDSVMHYGRCAFSINCQAGPTIEVLPPFNAQWQFAIGQRNHLSELDQATVSFLYPFANWRFVHCTYNGSNGPPDGTFLRPYTSFATALDNTPVGGTLWILHTCSSPAEGTYSKNVTVRAAPGVVGTLGS